jgi:hypothetical protein
MVSNLIKGENLKKYIDGFCLFSASFKYFYFVHIASVGLDTAANSRYWKSVTFIYCVA